MGLSPCVSEHMGPGPLRFCPMSPGDFIWPRALYLGLPGPYYPPVWLALLSPGCSDGPYYSPGVAGPICNLYPRQDSGAAFCSDLDSSLADLSAQLRGEIASVEADTQALRRTDLEAFRGITGES